MTERPYRSGAQQACLICRQSVEIQETVKKMGPNKTIKEIITWLQTKGIAATWSQVRFYLIKTNVQFGKNPISPMKNYKSRLQIYIEKLLEHDTNAFTIHDFGFSGPTWNGVTIKLHQAGLIFPLRHYNPIRWEILASMEEIQAWRDSELKRLEDKADSIHR